VSEGQETGGVDELYARGQLKHLIFRNIGSNSQVSDHVMFSSNKFIQKRSRQMNISTYWEVVITCRSSWQTKFIMTFRK
jgi:hypothetical protein